MSAPFAAATPAAMVPATAAFAAAAAGVMLDDPLASVAALAASCLGSCGDVRPSDGGLGCGGGWVGDGGVGCADSGGVSTHDSVGERGSVRGRGWQDPRAGWLQKGRHCVAADFFGLPERGRAEESWGDCRR